ncbi:MAG: type 4a pilus biogenesis protein PilO [Planctomycetes bacterium]|nr:type 4a pilus biogenesis protein PilO [Planctomycetota bacterium]
MMRLFEKQQLVITGLVIAIVVGFVFFRYIPLARRTQEINQSKQRYLQETLEVKDQAQRLPIVISKMEQLKVKVGDFDRKIPIVREFGSLWDQIAAVMSKCGLKEQLIQPRDEVKGSEICLIPINMQCRGNLQEIFSFFQSLENFERVICIESLSMVGSAGKDSVGDVKLTANANIYYRPAEMSMSGGVR